MFPWFNKMNPLRPLCIEEAASSTQWCGGGSGGGGDGDGDGGASAEESERYSHSNGKKRASSG